MGIFGVRCSKCGKYVLSWKEFEDGTVICNICYAKMKNPHEDIIHTLNMRYAKGEITKEQYEQMKKDLKG